MRTDILRSLIKQAYLFVLSSAVLLFAAGCQEKIDWDLEMENELTLIVQGKITNERKAHEVKLTLPIYEINGEERPLSNAQVRMSDGSTVITLKEDSIRPGVYMTGPDVQGDVNRTYYLEIEVRDFTFYAAAKMDSLTTIRYPAYRLVQEDPLLYELYFTGSDRPSIMKIELDWSHLPDYDTLPADQNHAVVFGYNFGSLQVDVNELYASNRDRVFFPPGTNVIISKESLSEGYEAYLRGVLSETTWNGSMFDVKAGDPFSNISAGALGYFAATSVLRDTLVFWP